MMAPKYERLRLLHLALEEGGNQLADPIDRIEVRGRFIVVAAGDEEVHMTFGYQNSYSDGGAPVLGGGSWFVRLVDAPRRAERSGFRRLLTLLGLSRKPSER